MSFHSYDSYYLSHFLSIAMQYCSFLFIFYKNSYTITCLVCILCFTCQFGLLIMYGVWTLPVLCIIVILLLWYIFGMIHHNHSIGETNGFNHYAPEKNLNILYFSITGIRWLQIQNQDDFIPTHVMFFRVLLCKICFWNVYDHRNGGKPRVVITLRWTYWYYV